MGFPAGMVTLLFTGIEDGVRGPESDRVGLSRCSR
jgi:hypothetical protein